MNIDHQSLFDLDLFYNCLQADRELMQIQLQLLRFLSDLNIYFALCKKTGKSKVWTKSRKVNQWTKNLRSNFDLGSVKYFWIIN